MFEKNIEQTLDIVRFFFLDMSSIWYIKKNLNGLYKRCPLQKWSYCQTFQMKKINLCYESILFWLLCNGDKVCDLGCGEIE